MSAHENEPSVFAKQLDSLSRGAEMAQDGFTYRAAFAAFVPVVLVVVLASLSVSSRLSSLALDPADALSSFLRSGLGWTVMIVIVVVLSSTWATIAVGIKAKSPRDVDTRGMYTRAAVRVPTVIGVYLLLVLAGVLLAGATWALVQIADVPVVSFVVAVLTLPLAGAWAAFVIASLASGVFAPALAAVDERAGSTTIASRALGLMLGYATPSLLLVVLAGVVATTTGLVFYFAAFSAFGAGVAPIASAMSFGGRTASAAITGIVGVVLFGLAFVAPWGVFVGSIADYARSMSDDELVNTVAGRAIGAGRKGVHQAASLAGAAAEVVRERANEAIERSEAARGEQEAEPGAAAPIAPATPPVPSDEPADPSEESAAAPPSVTGSTDTPEATPRAAETDSEEDAPQPASGAFCANCGTSNPADFRFCKACGTPAP